MCKQTIFPNHLHQRGTLSKGSFGKPDYFIPSDPGTMKLSIFLFFFFWTDMSRRKTNKHRIKALPWSDPPTPGPQRLPSHTRRTLTTHILHTHACVLIPLFRQQNGEGRPPPGPQSHTLSIFHTNGAYSPLELSPLRSSSYASVLLQLAGVAPPTRV